MVRPLATVGFTGFAALWLAARIGLTWSIAAAALLFVLFLAELLLRLLRGLPHMAIPMVRAALLTASAAFALFAVTQARVVLPLQALDGQTCTFRAQVTEAPQVYASSRAYTVRVLDGTPELPAGTRLTLWLYDAETSPDAYDLVSGTWRLSCPDKGETAFSAADGIFLQASPAAYDAAVTIETPSEKPWMAAVLTLRQQIATAIATWLPGTAGQLARGICLGATGTLPRAVTEAFRLSGVSHLLAVSGLHMAIVAQLMLTMLLALRVPRRAAAAIAALAVALFMALTGFTPSVMRAGVMCLLYLLGLLIGREADGLNSLGLAILVLFLVNPFAVQDVGLQLSFGATLGLLTLQPRLYGALVRPIRKRLPEHGPGRWAASLLRLPLEALCLTLSATLPIVPILALTFGELSLVAPLTNLLAVFPSTLLLMATCLAVALALVPGLPFLANGLFWAGGLLARYLLWVTSWLAEVPFAVVSMRADYRQLWLCGALLLLAIGWWWQRRRGIRLTAALAVMALCIGLLTDTALSRGVTSLTVADSEDCAVVLLEREGHAALFLDSCERVAVRQATSLLREHGIRTLDFLLFGEFKGNGISLLPRLREQAAVAAWLYPDGDCPLTLEALAGERQMPLSDGALRFWGDSRVERSADGWLRLTLGSTRVLFCPANADAATLPDGWKQTHLSLYAAHPPRQAALVQAQAGVWCATPETCQNATEKMPWGVCPIRMTAQDGEITVKTRGRGDLTFF